MFSQLKSKSTKGLSIIAVAAGLNFPAQANAGITEAMHSLEQTIQTQTVNLVSKAQSEIQRATRTQLKIMFEQLNLNLELALKPDTKEQGGQLAKFVEAQK
ncbi:MAG: hypothetical protein ACPGUD_00650 [Parashewanella sp.]